MLAGRSVGAAAGAELDPALVEMLLEFGHLRLGGCAVLASRALGPAPVEELLVVADYVLVEDR